MSTAKFDFASFVLFFNVNESYDLIILHTVKHGRAVRLMPSGHFAQDWRKFLEFHVKMPHWLVIRAVALEALSVWGESTHLVFWTSCTPSTE